MIIFVGDKPGSKNVDPDVPFVGTQSYKRLLEWIWELDIDISEVKLYNKDDVGPALRYGDISIGDTFIALGELAFEKLNNLEIVNRNGASIPKTGKYDMDLIGESSIRLTLFKLPHPSGRNRKLNDKKWLKKQLKECKKWLNS